MTQDTIFDEFRQSLQAPDIIKSLRNGLIGHDHMIEGPFGETRMVYADYVASGRPLKQVERFVMERFLPHYANSHTEASFVGGLMTRWRRQARDEIRSCCGASDDHAVIFCGTGATGGINRIVHLFGVKELVAQGARPLVLIGPYEHHSNILPWRETGAEVIELPEGDCAGPCPDALAQILAENASRPIFAALSAMSNVTGTLTEVTDLTRQLKAAGAKVIWDYAGGAPYLNIDMNPAEEAQIDAVVLSPHKFIGGPQASGLLLVRRDAVIADKPTFPGGGTVRFVSPSTHDYACSIEAREEAGTPNVIGDLRAALCLLVKEAVGQEYIDRRNARNLVRALKKWAANPEIDILGRTDCSRLPIFSFRIRDGAGGYVHQQLVTRMLSDLYGIQARGGCACAGPYVHRLLGIDPAISEQMRAAILAGHEIEKPGFVRLNFSYLASSADVDFIIGSVDDLSRRARDLVHRYQMDPATAIFRPAA